MNELPLWAALLIGLLLVISGCATLVGSLGLLRLRSFYERMHAPTMGTTLGVFCLVLASSLAASLTQHHPVLYAWLICLFLILTTPVTAILLMQSGLHRQGRTPTDPTAAPHDAGENPYTIR